MSGKDSLPLPAGKADAGAIELAKRLKKIEVQFMMAYAHLPTQDDYLYAIMTQSINFEDKFSKFTALWTPKILAQFDDYYIKAAKFKGEFVWHSHQDADETFIVTHGCLKINFRDGHVIVNAGEAYIVPKGVEHKPEAQEETHVLLIEKAGTLNTGSNPGERTVSDEEWI